jgi:uncharacterized protein YbjQ (UPF0145 family)
MTAWLDALVTYRPQIVAAVAVLLALLVVQRVMRAIARRRPPAPLNPRLARYAGRSEAEIAADREAAMRIIATGSGHCLAGYRIVRQIEAVFVEGQRSPEEAVSALKAQAGRRGANAVVNLSQARTAAGKCTAQGDAVLIEPEGPPAAAAGPSTKGP